MVSTKSNSSRIFQLAASRGGRPGSPSAGVVTLTFNSRPHEEADLRYSRQGSYQIVFQLAASRGGRRRLQTTGRPLQTFNSRPHEEADTTNLLVTYYIIPFNSRPHEEADAFLTGHR